jgi:hypothetical protein
MIKHTELTTKVHFGQGGKATMSQRIEAGNSMMHGVMTWQQI